MIGTMGSMNQMKKFYDVGLDKNIENFMHRASKIGGLITAGQTIYGGVREGIGIANGSIQLKGKNNWQNDLNLFSMVGGGAMVAGHLTMAFGGQWRPTSRGLKYAANPDEDDMDSAYSSVYKPQTGLTGYRTKMTNFDMNELWDGC